MRAWIELDEHEGPFVEAVRAAGHRRTHSISSSEFLVSLVDIVDAEGSTLHGYETVERLDDGPPGPRFELQVLNEPIYRDDVGTFGAAWRTIDRNGRTTCIGFAIDVTALAGSFTEFLLTVGEGEPSESLVQTTEVPELVEEFLTLWVAARDEIILSAEDQRVADALVAMVAELVKVADPPAGILRESFGWLARKLDVFAEHFAASAGTTLGPIAALGVGGQLPRVVEAVDQILRNL